MSHSNRMPAMMLTNSRTTIFQPVVISFFLILLSAIAPKMMGRMAAAPAIIPMMMKILIAVCIVNAPLCLLAFAVIIVFERRTFVNDFLLFSGNSGGSGPPIPIFVKVFGFFV